MHTLMASAVLVFLLLAVAFVVLFRRLLRPCDSRSAEEEADWWADFSLEKYRPMERLFCPQDYEFLASQPGFTPALARRLRAERRRVFRRYLRCLRRDFDRLYAAAKQLLLYSTEDRPDLAKALFRQWLLFRYALLAVHLRLALQTLGLGSVDARGLIGALEAVRDQLRMLAAAPAPVPLHRD